MKDFKLDNHPKINTGFIAPDGYFDNLSQKISNNIPQNEAKVIPLNSRKSWLFSAAAILIIALCISITFKLTAIPAETDEAALENYITIHSGISESDLLDLLDEEDIKRMNVSFNVESNEIEDILVQNTDVEQYLIN